MRYLRALATAIAATLGLVVGCGDEPTLPSQPLPPQDAAEPVSLNPVSMKREDRAALTDALRFTGVQSGRALRHQAGASGIAAAFAEVAGRVEADDRAGAERAIANAREAVKRYRELPGTAAAGADLEAIELTLEVASMLYAQNFTN